MRNKYYAKKVTQDGHTFDSKHEAERYSELKLLERAGQIENLQLQVPFVLLPIQKGEDGKTLELGVRYIADFVYTENGYRVTKIELRKGQEKYWVDPSGKLERRK